MCIQKQECSCILSNNMSDGENSSGDSTADRQSDRLVQHKAGKHVAIKTSHECRRLRKRHILRGDEGNGSSPAQTCGPGVTTAAMQHPRQYLGHGFGEMAVAPFTRGWCIPRRGCLRVPRGFFHGSIIALQMDCMGG